MDNSKLINISLIGAISLGLAACGGSSSDNSNGGAIPIAKASISGLAIDGYVKGATAFLDYNFNGIQDADEPASTTNELGRFDFTDVVDICKEYSPVIIDVPVGAIDSDYGKVTEAYRLTFPPRFSSEHAGDDLFATTPFTTVIWSAISEQLTNSGVEDCVALYENQAIQDEIFNAVRVQEYDLANRYNIPVEELYADFIASGNTYQHELAQKLTVALAKGYTATATLRAQYPDAQRVTVEYYVEQDDAGELNNWFREERVDNTTLYSINVWSMTDETLLVDDKHLVYNVANTEIINGDKVEERVVANWFAPGNFYSCSNFYNYAISGDVSDVTKNYIEINVIEQTPSVADCLALDPSLVNPATHIRRIVEVDGRNTGTSASWGFAGGDNVEVDTTVEEIIRDGFSTNIDLAFINSYNFDLYSSDAYGANDWLRVAGEELSNGVYLSRERNIGGVHYLRTYNTDGTTQIECGKSFDTMSVVTEYDDCQIYSD